MENAIILVEVRVSNWNGPRLLCNIYGVVDRIKVWDIHADIPYNPEGAVDYVAEIMTMLGHRVKNETQLKHPEFPFHSADYSIAHDGGLHPDFQNKPEYYLQIFKKRFSNELI